MRRRTRSQAGGVPLLQLDRFLDEHDRDTVVDGVKDLPVLPDEPFGGRFIELGAASVAHTAGADVVRKFGDQLVGSRRNGLLRFRADQDFEEVGTNGQLGAPFSFYRSIDDG